jgi:multiple sugar transport system permease protein
MGKKSKETFLKILVHVILISLSVLSLIPFIWMILTSFKTAGEVFKLPLTWLPEKFMWENYIYMWQNAPWSRYFANTVFVTVAVIVGQLITCSLAAYAFSRLRFRGRDIIFFIYLGTMMIPFQVVMIPTFKIIKTLSLLDSLWSIIVPSCFSAFGVFLLRQFFLSIPVELEEAAKIDGCGYMRIFWEIIIKNSKPAITTLVIFTFMGTWNDFLRPLIFLNTQETWTLSLGLAKFQGTYVTQWNEMMAGSLITMIPVLIIFLFGQKYFVEGIAMTGLKG